MKYCDICQLDTNNLRLRKVRADDATLYYLRIGSRPEVTAHMLWEPHRSPAESEASIQKALQRYAEGKCYRWAIALKSDDSIIGIIELLRFNEQESSCSFAYMLGPEFWGNGYGTEALKAALDFAFCQMEIQKVEVDHFSTNPASGAVMRKAGMTFHGTEKEKYEKNGRKIDAVCYTLDRRTYLEGRTQ